MSFELSPHRPDVTFDMTTNREIEFDVRNATCVLDIHSNMRINMGEHGLEALLPHGNFSKWVNLGFNEGVAVTGLASCGAVFVANQDFSLVAAGHMSGDAQYVEEWCAALLGEGVAPHYMLWGTGAEGSRDTGGRVLLQYMRAFGGSQFRKGLLPPSRSPAVASCGAILLVRSRRGIASASYSAPIPFKRSGQAVREEKPVYDLTALLNHYGALKQWNDPGIVDEYCLVKSIAGQLNYAAPFPVTLDETVMKGLLSSHGKTIVKQYFTLLPRGYQTDFLTYRIFKTHPDWKN